MRTLFLYPNVQSQREMPIGIASLSAAIKEAGHKVKLFDTTFHDTNKEYIQLLDVFFKVVEEYRPEVILVSVLSNAYPFIVKFMKAVNVDVPVVIGGTQPTVAPEDTIKDFDIICIGEGEEAVVEFLDKLEKGEDITHMRNFWVRKDGKLYKNEVRPFIEDLNSLPYPDWSIFDDGHFIYPHISNGLKDTRVGNFELSRGCPYNCTYCINYFMQGLYKGKGKYHREKTVERAIDEMVYFKKKYKLQACSISDETFLLNDERIRKFCELYKEEVGLPFSIMTRPETITKERAELIKEAGCCEVLVGVESGDEEFRKKVLKRNYSNQQVIDAFTILRKVGIRTYSFNMIGLPYENKEMICKTINLNKKIKADAIQATLFYPFKGTELNEVCHKEGFIKKNTEMVNSYYTDTVLSLPDISKKEIVHLRNAFTLYVHMPKVMYPFVKMISNNKYASRAADIYFQDGFVAMTRRIYGKLKRMAHGR